MKLELISDIDIIYLLKKELEEIFLTFLKDLEKQLINTCNSMIIVSQANTFYV